MTAQALLSPATRAQDVWFDAAPTATLVVDRQTTVQAANASARSLFGELDAVGLRLEAVFGLSGAANGNEFLAAAEAGRAMTVRLNLSDQRLVEARTAPLPQGGAIVSLLDVTAYVRDAEAGARDPLTGLLNRDGLKVKLEATLAAAARRDVPVSVLCVELQRFKVVNDTLGHAISDALLVKVADRLRSATRRGDIVARMAGDGFAIVQADAGEAQAVERLGARIIDLLSRTYVVAGEVLNVGASVGATLSSSALEAAEDLIKRADVALGRAKAEGEGQFRFFEPQMDAAMQHRRALELDLRRALAMGEFELAFQPQYRLATDQLVGFEALLRWRSPTRGLVSPAEFIPVAEEIGIIKPIGEWVLRAACAEAAAWPRPLSIAVNLSPVQFQNSKLVPSIVSALAASGLAPDRLEIEITEGALLHDTDSVLCALSALREIGVRISMDDFGTGYSSLSYLQKFPFNKIKIDQSFVRRMEGDPHSRAIVRAVAALGAGLGMSTTAEGVETPQQLAQIRANGCTDVQGYLTGRPMPGPTAAALVAAALPLSAMEAP